MPTLSRQPNGEFWANVGDLPLVSGSTVGPKGFLYTFYLLADTQTPPGTCQLAILRWDGYDHNLIWSLDEATSCWATNWDDLEVSREERQGLGLQGYWSDINRNGLPELTISHYSGCVGCDEANSGEEAVYEIRDEGHIQNIVDGLRFEPWPAPMLHTYDPLTLYMYKYYSYDVHSYVRVGWVYQWDSGQFVNVS